MKPVLLAILPSVFVTLFGYTVLWAVEPEYLRAKRPEYHGATLLR
jgi:hypothetical protein